MKSPPPLGALEHAVMTALWQLDNPTARDIHRVVGEPSGLVYTTTAKVLDRLYAKGFVARKRVGRAFVYRPKLGRDRVERARTRESLNRILGSDPLPALANLVEAVEALDPELLDALSLVIEARRKARDES